MENSPESNWTLNNISRATGQNCAKLVNLMKNFFNETTKVVEKSRVAFQEGFNKENGDVKEDSNDVEINLHEI